MQENEDDTLLELAEKEGRILVSRDRVLVRKAIKRGIRTYTPLFGSYIITTKITSCF